MLRTITRLGRVLALAGAMLFTAAGPSLAAGPHGGGHGGGHSGMHGGFGGHQTGGHQTGGHHIGAHHGFRHHPGWWRGYGWHGPRWQRGWYGPGWYGGGVYYPYSTTIERVPVVDEQQEWGMKVTDVVTGSPAARAYLQVGDIIVMAADVRTQSFEELTTALATGGPVEMVVIRGKQEMELTVVPVGGHIGIATVPVVVE